MTDETLFADGDEPARIVGHGPIPAPIARALALRGGTSGNKAPRWLRRLYTAPDTGRLVAMESRRRSFTAGQRRFIDVRDDGCRTPWCDAPVRHYDHVTPYAQGGHTSVLDGRATCAACNYAREAPGWHAVAPDGAGTEVVLQTPTGHRYGDRPPELPTRTRRHRWLELHVDLRWLRAA